MKLWRIYRLDRQSDVYEVWALTRDAAVNAAHVEHFGLALGRWMLGAGWAR